MKWCFHFVTPSTFSKSLPQVGGVMSEKCFRQLKLRMVIVSLYGLLFTIINCCTFLFMLDCKTKPEAISPLNSIREDTEDNAFFDANSVMPTLVDVDAVGEAQPRSPEGEVESKKILSVSETIVRFLLMVSLIDFIKRHLRGFSQNKLLKFQKHADEPR